MLKKNYIGKHIKQKTTFVQLDYKRKRRVVEHASLAVVLPTGGQSERPMQITLACHLL